MGTAADRLEEIAPLIGKSEREIRRAELKQAAVGAWRALREAPSKLIALRAKWVEKSPAFMAQVREEWAEARPVVAEKLRVTTR